MLAQLLTWRQGPWSEIIWYRVQWRKIIYWLLIIMNWNGCRKILIQVKTPTVVHIESWSVLRLPTLAAFIATPTTASVPITAPSVPRTTFQNDSLRYNLTCRIDTNYIILWNKNNFYLTPASDPKTSCIVDANPCFS